MTRKAPAQPKASAPFQLARPSLDPLPEPGAWLWTCREGFDHDLAEELHLASRALGPRELVPSLVATRGAPPRKEAWFDVTFARQAMPVDAAVRAETVALMAERCADALLAKLRADTAWTLHSWVPDSTQCNTLSGQSSRLHDAIEQRIKTVAPAVAARLVSTEGLTRAGGFLAQACMASEDTVFVGVQPLTDAHSLRNGGRARMRVGREAPSRAAMKLEEAIDWLGYGPEKGDLCVDLGAAPGGWTWVVLERGARVIAVDPGRLAPEVAARRGVTEVHGSAFDFEPREPVDWLLCDMAWRPLEVAAMLAKWGRRRWARTLVSNIKLPMKQKNEFVAKVRAVVTSGGWRDVRARHLYHDREEVTLTAWRG